MNTRPLRFFRRGEIVTVNDVTPTRTLLELLRDDLHCTGTKEGCGEGDCGACTVVLGEENDGQLELKAINSCIRLAHSVDGLALWTVEDLQGPNGGLHPVQQSLVDCHGSQCGFCTPGFVMSLFSLYDQKQGACTSREEAQSALSGNLCRCTGYRPILDAAQAMHGYPAATIDRSGVLEGLRKMSAGQEKADSTSAYLSPTGLRDLLDLKERYPHAQLVAGCTDVGLWITKMHMDFERVIDVTRVQEIRRIEEYPHHTAIGAAVNLQDAFEALKAQRPQLGEFAHRFAGLPVRNSGTLGGNVANGSPIGDSMPLLIALGANVVLMHLHRGKVRHREMRLEDFYTGYRKNVMAPHEVLAWIKVPKPVEGEFSRVYKISKRMEDDISAVCLAIKIVVTNGRVAEASIGVGGVAATPVRAVQTENALRQQAWNPDTVTLAMKTLEGEFRPISDMRASAGYRSKVLGNLLQRFWLDSRNQDNSSLQSLTLDEVTA